MVLGSHRAFLPGGVHLRGFPERASEQSLLISELRGPRDPDSVIVGVFLGELSLVEECDFRY